MLKFKYHPNTLRKIYRYNFTSKNPDDNGRDFTLIRGSDSSPMVEMGGVEPPCCLQAQKPSTYLVDDYPLRKAVRRRATLRAGDLIHSLCRR